MKILFFAPHADIWVHSFPEALIAESLAQSGHEVVYVTCDRQFSNYCVAMSAASLVHASADKVKKQVCKSCERAAGLIRKHFGFRSLQLGDAVSEHARTRIREIVSSATQENFLDLELEGVEVGRFALYELLLHYKKQSLVFSKSEWQEYRTKLDNALVSFFGFRDILHKEEPERVVVYNSLYGVNHVACALAEQRGIPAYFLHAGGNLSHRLETMLIGRGDGVRFYKDLLAFYEGVKDLPCPGELLPAVTDHFLELLKGRNVFAYSAPKSSEAVDLRLRFQIPPDSRVLVATMSSPDERFAAEAVGVMSTIKPRTFSSQTEWIKALCAWISTRPDIFLIVRVHPREFANKREGVVSEHAARLSELLSELPGNVSINWPADQISLYDLAEITDVFLNAWSAAGKEMTLLGIPVVAYAPELLVYPPTLNYVASSPDGYFAKIDEALQDGWSIERTRATYRWCVLEYERAPIDLSESFRDAPLTRARLVKRAIHWFARRLWPDMTRRRDCLRRAPRLGSTAVIDRVFREGSDSLLDFLGPGYPASPINDETQVLRREVGRLVDALYGTQMEGTRRGKLYERLSSFAHAKQ